jgi:hypothetical protein
VGRTHLSAPRTVLHSRGSATSTSGRTIRHALRWPGRRCRHRRCGGASPRKTTPPIWLITREAHRRDSRGPAGPGDERLHASIPRQAHALREARGRLVRTLDGVSDGRRLSDSVRPRQAARILRAPWTATTADHPVRSELASRWGRDRRKRAFSLSLPTRSARAPRPAATPTRPSPHPARGAKTAFDPDRAPEP